MLRINQIPICNSRYLLYRGDKISFSLKLSSKTPGKAFIRTNIGRRKITSEEIIKETEKKQYPAGRDWTDYQMKKISETEFSISLPLLEVGHFEAKTLFLPSDKTDPVWPEGENVTINVESANTRNNNSIYCSFVRQFGDNKSCNKSSEKLEKGLKKLDKKGYTIIPPSGKFRDLINELDHIFETLNCNILHLLPIHPSPTVYAKMGRYGSPYAALDFTSVNPEYAEFDKAATPLDQFIELVNAVHAKKGSIIIDIAINHTGWAAKLHETHPEWLKRNSDNTIHQPGAWGTVWEDLTELDHSKKALWLYLADILLIWCERGVDGFRCDAGYMIPIEAWRYIISKIRMSYPNTIFLLEGLGGATEITEELLNSGNFNWAYSELFQNYTKQEIEGYLRYTEEVSSSKGLLMHYAETHDNLRLAGESAEYAKMRTALCALTAPNGTFGFANGVEWFATEKIDVHHASALNWNSEKNQLKEIQSLNTILNNHPAFFAGSTLKVINNNSETTVIILRNDPNKRYPTIIAINLDCKKTASAKIKIDSLSSALLPTKDITMYDLLSEKEIKVNSDKNTLTLKLAPAQALCLINPTLKNNWKQSPKILEYPINSSSINTSISHQYETLTEDFLSVFTTLPKIADCDIISIAENLFKNPYKTIINKSPENLFCTTWDYPQDLHRNVILPKNNFLLIRSKQHFRARFNNTSAISLTNKNGNSFAIFNPTQSACSEIRNLKITVYNLKSDDNTIKCPTHTAPILLPKETDVVRSDYTHPFNTSAPYTVLDTNQRGAMMRININRPQIYSKYDALLAANLNPDYPEGRHIFWRRCRIWIRHQGHSCELNHEVLEKVSQQENKTVFIYKAPIGTGQHVCIALSFNMHNNKNATHISIERTRLKGENNYLPKNIPVSIIIRPDIEDRNFHSTTKAFAGPENLWPNAIRTKEKEFIFTPDSSRKFSLKIDEGKFYQEHEWLYNIYHYIESSRGQEDKSDLFSPGYFSATLKENKRINLIGQALTPSEKKSVNFSEIQQNPLITDAPPLPLENVLKNAMRHFLVKRGINKTVIAGYPWFLDWGRDTLICCRGLIAAGWKKDVFKILKQFASFAEKGTIPNMIQGDDASDRDTSDAPLWLFAAARDYMNAYNKNDSKLEILDALQEIADGYIKGTYNGIKMDTETGLIFSPSHFTWMDTNYPAGTPRKGYPIEIQALWYNALDLLEKITEDKKWNKLKKQVKKSFNRLFPLKEEGYYADCLIAENAESAESAIPDDALRPNQLFAITFDLAEKDFAESAISNCQKLLIPGAIRSLADKSVEKSLRITDDNGTPLNDPDNPYFHTYEGNEDTRRKPAYHNGTAWIWPFPTYIEAFLKIYGKESIPPMISMLNSGITLLEKGCLHHTPEILDGDTPHTPRGCDAQAWGVTEYYRILKKLEK